MSIFDILGPVMVGPSSSHTAGAVRMGQITRRLLGGEPVRARILLAGSFASTGAGHGTPRAIVAGLMGFMPDDERIPQSFEIAGERGFQFSFGTTVLRDAHPNSAVLTAENERGEAVEVGASSPGGGRIRVFSLDGLPADFSGEVPTLIVRSDDKPGYVSRVTGVIAAQGINMSKLRVEREERGGRALMVIECDQRIPYKVKMAITAIEGVRKVTRLNPGEESK